MENAVRTFLSCCLLVSASFLTQIASAQLTVAPVNTGQTLANAITGNGVIVSNVTFSCPTDAAGTFNGNASNIGLSNGILLTTGAANLAVGPNSGPGTGHRPFCNFRGHNF